MAKVGRPAISPEAREKQLINLAVDVAEQQLREGTASSQIIVHFLKLGTSRAELEKEKIRNETEVLKAKAKAIDVAEESKIIAENAINAMRSYRGDSDDDEYEY